MNFSFPEVTINFEGFLTYSPKIGEYGLHRDGSIMKIGSWSTTISPQELHFNFKGYHEFGYTKDFFGFSDSKKALKNFRKFLEDTNRIKK